MPTICTACRSLYSAQPSEPVVLCCLKRAKSLHHSLASKLVVRFERESVQRPCQRLQQFTGRSLLPTRFPSQLFRQPSPAMHKTCLCNKKNAPSHSCPFADPTCLCQGSSNKQQGNSACLMSHASIKVEGQMQHCQTAPCACAPVGGYHCPGI